VGADTKLKSLTLGRGVGQSVYIGKNVDQNNPHGTADLRVKLKGIYKTKKGCVAILEITEKGWSALEVALADGHKEPVTVQDVEIYFTGVKQYVVEETQCPRCGSEQDGKPVRRINGLIRIRAPESAKISRGNRIGKNAR
jgi:RNA polymerase subunit RPABC4/transcription elongation factor Spt4